MGDCSVGDFLLVFLLLAIPHNGLSEKDGEGEVPVIRPVECLQLYSKPTGHKGDTLIIGSTSTYESVKHVFPDFDNEDCAPMNSDEYNVNKYGTKIFKRSNSVYFNVPVGEQLHEVTATDYFIHFGVQAFNCEVKKNGTEESQRYVKIVNSMSSIEDNIREIKYHSGVSVSIEKCGGRKCIQVTETKCMAKQGEDLVQIKCDYATGRLYRPSIVIPNMKDKHLYRRERTVAGYLFNREEEGNVTISEEGESFRIGINENPSGFDPTTPPQPSSRLINVECQPPIINPTIFHPECYQKVKNEGNNLFKDVLLNDEQFRKSFTVVDETVQICQERNTYGRVFYLVRMTVIGKTKVNRIMYGSGITELYSINFDAGAATVQYTDERIYDAITRTIVYDVYYKNAFLIDKKTKISTPNSAPAAHTPSDAEATSRSLDVDYKLWPEGIYSTFISGDGYSLLVGSKPKLDIDFGTASCKKVDYLSDFKTELKIIAENGGESYAHLTENIDNWSRIIQQQSWRCEYNDRTERRSYFIRVVNHLEILEPVHMLQSYDGVEILRRPSAEKYILEIFELKYLLENPDNPEDHLTPIRASGDISFAADDRPSDTDTAYAMGRGFNAISKSEVHPRFISQIPKRAHNRNDYYRADTFEDHTTLWIEGGSPLQMRFTTKLMKQDEIVMRSGMKIKKPFTGLFVCKLGKMDWMVEQIPYFEIIRFGMNAGNNNDKQALNDEYFGNFTQEYWTCLKTGDETPKYSRITTKSRIIVKCDAHTLKSIQFTFVDDVRLELLESTGSSDNSKYDITYEGVRYYRNDGGEQIINIDFGGYFILESTPSGQVWTSGTINLKKLPSTSKVTVHVDKTQQVYYSDGNRGREYRFHLPGDQTSKEWQEKRMMRIGEINRVQQKIRLPPGTPSLQCYENTTIAGTADSDIRLQMLVQTFNYSSQGNAAGFHQQYYAANTRVWKCISTAGQIEILRVMNNFVVKAAEVEKIRTILYSDGVAIFSDLKNVRILEIAEVKFLNAKDYSKLKYDGALEFESSSENVGLHSIKLHYPKIQDVNYILNDNEFFKTTFPAVLGDTLEIREPHPGMKSDEDKKGTRFQETIRCDEFVGESFFSEEVRNNVIKPKVILLQQKAKKKEIPPSIITDLPMYFDDIKKTIRRCEEEGTSSTKLYRVQTQMKLKTKIKIRHIFHQNGVKIHEDYNGRHMIEITSYFEKKTIEHQSAFVPVQFEGLVILPLQGLQEKFENDAKNPQNHLDKQILQFSALSREEGVTYLVQSEFHSTIDNSEGGIVACLKYEDKNTAQADYMQTKILVNENSNRQKPKKTWNEVDRRNTDHILYESYEAWSCKYQEDDFTRVVNKMLVKDTARVYYPDGVEVQRLILLNGETYIQIKHVRFFKSEQGKIHAIKFIGRLQLEIPSLPGLEKMLSSPPFNIQVIGKQDEEKEPSPYRPRYIFTWDSMRYAAFKDLGKRSDGINQSPPIRFSSDMDSLQTKFLNARSSRIFQLGRFWNKKLNSEGTVTMKCFVYLTANLRALKYKISPEDAKIKYNPRVAEYIDQTLYIFTQDEIDEIFTITRVRTWYCTDKTDEFLKVQTFYNTTTIPFAVRYTDGVEVKLENENLKITETIYINMMNSRVYNRQQDKRKEGDLMEFVIYPSQNKQRAQTAQTGKGKGNNIKERTPTCCG